MGFVLSSKNRAWFASKHDVEDELPTNGKFFQPTNKPYIFTWDFYDIWSNWLAITSLALSPPILCTWSWSSFTFATITQAFHQPISFVHVVSSDMLWKSCFTTDYICKHKVITFVSCCNIQDKNKLDIVQKNKNMLHSPTIYILQGYLLQSWLPLVFLPLLLWFVLSIFRCTLQASQVFVLCKWHELLQGGHKV